MSICDHRWPRNVAMHSIRSIGGVEISECNNCLAVKIVTTTHDLAGKETKTEQVVEPVNNQTYLK